MMHVAVNEGMSSSILKPQKHLEVYPHIEFDEKEQVEMTTLDNLMAKKELSALHYNFLLIDVRGYELEVLKGGRKTPDGVDYILSEINGIEMYKRCALVEELDDYLDQFGFCRVVTVWQNKRDKTWGDAFYIKKPTLFQQHISANIYWMLLHRYHLPIRKFQKSCESFYKNTILRRNHRQG